MNRSTWAAALGAAIFLVSGLAACDPNQLPSCTDGGESCLCTPGVSGTCNLGLVCDEVVSLCREPLTCPQALCATHQVCEPPGVGADVVDAACLDACDPGFRWNPTAGRCDAVDSTCSAKLEAKCAGEHRACTVPVLGGDPYCGSCVDGYTDELGTCRPRVPCATIAAECALKNRECKEAWFGPNEDARCGPCPEGTSLDDVGTCRCVTPLTAWDPEQGACVAVKTCKDLTCADGEVCVAAAGDQDAYCDEGCVEGYLWSALTDSCLPCPPCQDFPGADDSVGQLGRILNATQDTCLCATKPGWFFSSAGQVGVFPCDLDGDGWVRESARAAMYASEPLPTGVDRMAAIRENARCKVRKAETWVLANDHGETRAVAEPLGALLFESDRNDDDKLLALELAITHLDRPFGGGDGKASPGAGLPRASQLNRLTRYCHLPGSDYNDNGVADVAEWQEGEPAKEPAEALQTFNRYSVFAELHGVSVGTWDAATSAFAPLTSLAQDATGPTEQPVAIRIQERPRTDAAFPLRSLATDAWWQQCTRQPDALADVASTPAGVDFAWDAAAPHWPAWRGMTHSSQFRCLQVVPIASASATAEVGLGAGLAAWELNRCQSAGGSGDFAPSCAVQPAETAAVGDVRWALARFTPYHDTFLNNGPRTRVPSGKAYARGCVDECAELQQALDVPGQFAGAVQALAFPTQGYASGCGIAPGFAAAADLVCSAHGQFGDLGGCEELCGDGLEGDGNPATPDAVPAGVCDTLLGGACGAGKSACFKGLARCMPNLSLTPALKDQCDGVDEDCDGLTDEDGADGKPGAQISVNGSWVPAGTACVSAARKGVCAAGKWQCTDDASGGPECRATATASQELCDGLDNDCDGLTDEEPKDAKIGQKCVVTGSSYPPSTLCGAGAWGCAGGALACQATYSPQTERCNGLDDDCDGFTDEGTDGGLNGACECDVLTPELWFHGRRDNTWTAGALSKDNETVWVPLQHKVTVGVGSWTAGSSALGELKVDLNLEVQEKDTQGKDGNTNWLYKRSVFVPVGVVDDPLPGGGWYHSQETFKSAVDSTLLVRWTPEGAATYTSCAEVAKDLPNGVASVTWTGTGPESITYTVSDPQAGGDLAGRVFDLFGSPFFKAYFATLPDGATTKYLPRSLPGSAGAASFPYSYTVSWCVDRFELAPHLRVDASKVLCRYHQQYPTLFAYKAVTNCNGQPDPGTHVDALGNEAAKGPYGCVKKALGGTMEPQNDDVRFQIKWDNFPQAATSPVLFRRIRSAPGWGPDGNDHQKLFWQTWLKLRVRLTPKSPAPGT